ncbi:hypothetical protein LBMAG42_07020 [Deltaproteobacteria bacterium]|nr:hypothetical protein LBMAG42_07020 [Deltaproteobacteria bacterium]
MHTFLITFHIILSLLLVFIILMQPGKGADMSSAFGGGGGSQLFGASGPGNFLTRGTGVIATLFMVTSITLAYQSTRANQAGGGAEEGFKKTEGEGAEGSGFGAKKPEETAPVVTPAPTEAPADAPAGEAVPAPEAGPAPEAAPAPEATPAAPLPGAPQ